MDKAECEDKYSEPETEEHKQGKKDLYEWLKLQDGVTNVVLEGWLTETHQRPDIMFEYRGQKCVLEFQCAPISSEYEERHALYRAANIKDIWICGVQKYTNQFTKKQKRIATMDMAANFLYYDPLTKQLFKIDTKLSEEKYDKIIAFKNGKYGRKSKYFIQYRPDLYTELKSSSNNYYTEYHYPSPTGRPSNKYPYPVADYIWKGNYSLANRYYLNRIKLTEVKN